MPQSVLRLASWWRRFPGIGPKSAMRMAMFVVNADEEMLGQMVETVMEVKKKVRKCRKCFGLTENEECEICQDARRDRKTICVVERPVDVLALEESGEYRGLYHVLGGVINPLDFVGPEDLTIGELIKRVGEGGIIEVILAMNPTVEGEATAVYIKNRLGGQKVEVTRLGSGLPVGGDLEYADKGTVSRAINGRRGY